MSAATNEPAGYRVRQEDGYCWVDPKTGQAQPEKKIVLPSENAQSQLYKLEPLNAAQLEALKRPEAAPEAPMNRAIKPTHPEYRSRKA